MNGEEIAKLAGFAALCVSAIFGFFRWFKEYRLKQELTRFEVLQKYRDRFRSESAMARVHSFLIDRRGPKPRDSEVFFYIGQFEEVWLLAKRGLVRKEDAFNFFGWYADKALKRYKIAESGAWKEFHEFLQAYRANADKAGVHEKLSK